MKKKNLSLIGCGWLGKPLAIELHKSGQQVLATTAHDKSTEFQKEGVPYISLDVGNSIVPSDILHSDALIYMVPPMEVSLVKNFFDQIPADKKVIFISSTSVYGKDLHHVDEKTELLLSQTNSPVLIETEDYLRKRFSHLTILRFGGLYGEKRHPIYFLQGKKELKGAQEFLHLVHLNDCHQAIKTVIEKNIWGETFNIISDLRIRKSEYYIEMATKLSLIPPEYIKYAPTQKETLISNEKSKIKLGMSYLNPSEFCTFSE